MSTQHSEPRLLIPALKPLYQNLSPLAELSIRVITGFMMIPHGAQKLFGWFGGKGLDGTAAWMAKMGYEPAYLAALSVGFVEFFCGLAIMIGLFTRPAAVACFAVLLVAIPFLSAKGWFWNYGGIEYAVFWAICTLTYVIRGGGRYSLDRKLGFEF